MELKQLRLFVRLINIKDGDSIAAISAVNKSEEEDNNQLNTNTL